MQNKNMKQIIILFLCFYLNAPFCFLKKDCFNLDEYAPHFVQQGIRHMKKIIGILRYIFKSTAFPSTATQELWYMLIMSELYAEKYEDLLLDVYEFKKISQVYLTSFIEYQEGRAHYYLKQWDLAISVLSDFCVTYPEHELYASSLFWIAETLYAMHYYSLAASFYERIADEYPKSVKMTEVLYRLDVIHQREKEEKLLLLLQATSEEYLSSKEEYERQLRQFQTEEAIGLRKQLNDAQAKIAQLEFDKNEADLHSSLQAEEIVQLQNLLDNIEKNEAKSASQDLIKQIQMLKEKAAQIKIELEENTLGEE